MFANNCMSTIKRNNMIFLKKSTEKDIINWDIINWSKAIKYWRENITFTNKNYKCLELGANQGGLSLWLALHRNRVVCSDLQNPKYIASAIHEKYTCKSPIQYAAIDATNIPYKNYFDIITFKSILGGISENNQDKFKRKTVNEIHKALKPGGVLLFAENMEATLLHKILRKRWGQKDWNYMKLNEIADVFSLFKNVNYTTVGFFGCMGRSETQRRILGHIDTFIEKLLPNRFHYILIGIAVK